MRVHFMLAYRNVTKLLSKLSSIIPKCINVYCYDINVKMSISSSKDAQTMTYSNLWVKWWLWALHVKVLSSINWRQRNLTRSFERKKYFNCINKAMCVQYTFNSICFQHKAKWRILFDWIFIWRWIYNGYFNYLGWFIIAIESYWFLFFILDLAKVTNTIDFRIGNRLFCQQKMSPKTFNLPLLLM